MFSGLNEITVALIYGASAYARFCQTQEEFSKWNQLQIGVM